MGREQIRRGSTPPHIGKIPAVAKPPDGLLRFSFKHLDLNHPKFCTSRCRTGYLDRLLTRLRDVSTIRVQEFRTNRSPSLRAHQINFSETTEPAGFTSLNSQLRDEEAWQFEITRNEHGRLHGLLIIETFYVVWIDPDHKLYP